MSTVAPHWAEARLRYHVDLNPSVRSDVRTAFGKSYPFFSMDAIGEDGTVRRDTERPVDELLTGYSYFENQDFLLAKVTPCFENGKSALIGGLPENAGFGTTEVTVIRPRRSLEGRFLYYLTAEDQFKQSGVAAMTGAGGLKRVPDSFVRDFKFPLPPRDRQRQIADYLDAQTAKIDALIGKQEQLIETLAERNRALLRTAADSAGAAKRVRMKFLFRQSRVSNAPELEVLSVFRDHGVVPKSSRADNFNKTPEDVSRYLVVSPGDLVVNKMKAWQGSLGISSHLGIVSADYEVLNPTSKLLDAQFANSILRSSEFISQYGMRSVGIRPSQWRLYWDQLVSCAGSSL